MAVLVFQSGPGFLSFRNLHWNQHKYDEQVAKIRNPKVTENPMVFWQTH